MQPGAEEGPGFTLGPPGNLVSTSTQLRARLHAHWLVQSGRHRTCMMPGSRVLS